MWRSRMKTLAVVAVAAMIVLAVPAAARTEGRMESLELHEEFCKSDADCALIPGSRCLNDIPGAVPPFVCKLPAGWKGFGNMGAEATDKPEADASCIDCSTAPDSLRPSTPAQAPTKKQTAKYGTTCTTDADCPQSYCLNYPPHVIEPHFCHDTDAPLCATPTLQCQHTGSLYEVSCETAADCPKGSYCMNSPGKVRPFVCHMASAPACACDCNSAWIGNECQTWNSTGGPGNNKKINQYFQFLGQEEKQEMAKQAAVHPFNGFIGFGIDMSTGAIKLPAVELTYNNEKNTIGTYRLPDQVKFTQAPAGGSVAYDVANFASFAPLRSTITAQRAALSKSQQPFTGLFKEQGQVSQYATFFQSNSAMGYARQTVELYDMSLDVTPTPDRWFQMGAATLPTSYDSASAKAALAACISNWGTHFVSSASLGGSLEMRSNYDWWLLGGTAWATGLGNAGLVSQITADFELVSGVDSATGAPLTAAQKAAASATQSTPAGHLYATNRQQPAIDCAGGNPEDCSADFASWRSSLNPSSVVPVSVQLTPLWELLPPGGQRTALQTAITALLADQEASWASAPTCPSCKHGGSCSGTATSCTCTNADHTYERDCGSCEAGWGAGGNCAAPICEGCNVGGGSCASPGHCVCHSCYAGPHCDTYTCGCFDGASTLQLADGTSKPLTEVALGDEVLSVDAVTGELTYSPVYHVAASNAEGTKARVVEVGLDSGRRLRLTEEHLVYSLGNPLAGFSGAEEVMAVDLKVGQSLWSLAADGKELELARVESVSVVEEELQLVSVYTVAGPVVVDGVAASSYEWSSAWRLLENAEARFMFQYLPSVAKSDWYRNVCDSWDLYVTEPSQPAIRAVASAVATATSWVVDTTVSTAAWAGALVAGGASS